MKCQHCDAEIIPGAKFCFSCGAPVPQISTEFQTESTGEFNDKKADPASENAALYPTMVYADGSTVNQGSLAQKVTSLCKDKLFLVICILVSSGTLFTVMAGSLDVIAILQTIFIWLLFAEARKNTLVSHKQIRHFSGTFFAQYVLNWVVVGALGLLIISTILSTITLSSGEALNILEQFYRRLPFTDNLANLLNGDLSLLTIGFEFIAIVLVIVFIFVTAAVSVLNILVIRRIHKYFQTGYKTMEMNGDLPKNNETHAITILCYVCAGIIAAGALMSLFSASILSRNFIVFLANGSVSAAYIMLGLSLSKHIK